MEDVKCQISRLVKHRQTQKQNKCANKTAHLKFIYKSPGTSVTGKNKQQHI